MTQLFLFWGVPPCLLGRPVNCYQGFHINRHHADLDNCVNKILLPFSFYSSGATWDHVQMMENEGKRLTWNCSSCLWGVFHRLPLMLVVSCPYLVCWGNKKKSLCFTVAPLLNKCHHFSFWQLRPPLIKTLDYFLFSIVADGIIQENAFNIKDSLGGLNPFIIKFSGHQWLRELTEVWFQSPFGWEKQGESKN